MEPSVKILYSESNHLKLQPGSVMSLGSANDFFEQRDRICADYNAIENIVYEISYMVNTEQRTYCCSQNLGDGEGSVINHLRKSTIDALKTLETSGTFFPNTSSKNPFSILRTSCQNMLQYVLPQLEAYCLAYRMFDVVEAFEIDNYDLRLQDGISAVTKFILDEPITFIASLEDVIRKNPENVSLISAVETLIDKTEKYMSLMSNKDGKGKDLVGILEKATERATAINENSVLNCEPPPSSIEQGLF